MCRAVTCKKCHKPTWAGCGAHVEQVLHNVPEAQRCTCRERPAASATSTTSTGPTSKTPGFAGSIRRLFGLE